MSVNDLPLMQALRGRLSWLDQRQRVIAENVANADTPGYAARDLRAPTDFARALQTAGGLPMARTSSAHLTPPNRASGRFEARTTPDSETTLDGNSVVVEEQMLKMTESRMAHDAAISFYQKSMQMVRLAARPPGR